MKMDNNPIYGTWSRSSMRAKVILSISVSNSVTRLARTRRSASWVKPCSRASSSTKLAGSCKFITDQCVNAVATIPGLLQDKV
jgi:hypothetical protein